MAQFGDGDFIPSLNLKERKVIRKEQCFSGEVVLSFKEAVDLMNENKRDMNTWVVRPEHSVVFEPFFVRFCIKN